MLRFQGRRIHFKVSSRNPLQSYLVAGIYLVGYMGQGFESLGLGGRGQRSTAHGF